jgi:hypothetical protein
VPHPWRGDAGVTFVGCDSEQTCSSYNAGAIRIDNPAPNPALTLTSASVDIGDCHFQPWGALLPVTANAGGSVILTQSGLYGPAQPVPCEAALQEPTRPYWNFYTAGRPYDTRTSFNCDTTTGVDPVITLVFSDGMTLTVTDAARVLNTGGINRSVCFGGSSATPWTAVPGSSIVRVP